ncbi:type I 3-dehydroquinate dehydratase [Orbaceae bacterium ac157xtp]
MRTIEIKNITIDSGKPKIIVPIIGSTEDELLGEIAWLKFNNVKFHIIEWRADYFSSDAQQLTTILKKIRQQLINTPLLFTFRTANEGGEKAISNKEYRELINHIIQTKLIDLVDIEFFMDEAQSKQLIDIAHNNHVYVIGSNHHFSATPSQQEIVERLMKMQIADVDIPKIAVMPNSVADVITLLAATNEMASQHADRPIITMSMGKLGVISRIAGETFGSAITFGAAQKTSAPGQLNANELHTILNSLHSV